MSFKKGFEHFCMKLIFYLCTKKGNFVPQDTNQKIMICHTCMNIWETVMYLKTAYSQFSTGFRDKRSKLALMGIALLL